ncbi:putative DUF3050 domain-containing protein [Gammaproteobacteria bacterium]
MTKDNVKTKVKALLNHKALIHLGSGSATLTQIKSFAEQYGFVSICFSKMLARAMSSISDADRQFEILKNLWDEYGCGNRENDHRKMYYKFLNKLGINELNEVAMLASTKQYIEGMLSICSTENNDDYIMGSISYGCEYFTKNQYKILLNGFHKSKYFTENDLTFFHEHALHDGQHTVDLLSVVYKKSQSNDVNQIYLGALAAIELEIKFWDGLAEINNAPSTRS